MPEDTIAAIATPPGRGGLGVVRLSGSLSFSIVTRLLKLREAPPSRQATLADFIDQNTGAVLDRVLLTCFAAPKSYTGEDVAEVSCHGSPVILQHFVERCVAEGARPAEPGEFTMRSFLNGCMDLTQAEAVRDLIDARTLFQARVAARQMAGSVSASLKPAKEKLAQLIAALEAGIDFAEDDLSVMSWEDIEAQIERVQKALEAIARGHAYGKFIREGMSLTIAGRPNVGKSSLFNRLLDEPRAIVTAIPGTTRDCVSETASIGGIPARLMDTAGIRETADPVESLGVARSLAAAADADARLLVLDASEGVTREDTVILDQIRPHGPLLIACNKSDLPPRVSAEELARFVRNDSGASLACVWVSALTGDGIVELKEKLLSLLAPARQADPGGEFITNLRHRRRLDQAVASLARARAAAERRIHHEMLLLDLYDALRSLGALTGETTTDDLLSIIFSTFCVGK